MASLVGELVELHQVVGLASAWSASRLAAELLAFLVGELVELHQVFGVVIDGAGGFRLLIWRGGFIDAALSFCFIW